MANALIVHDDSVISRAAYLLEERKRNISTFEAILTGEDKRYEGVGVNPEDVKRENNQKGKNAKMKDAWNKSYLNPEEDPRFHDTYKFLRRYRDATYSLKVVVHQMETQFRMRYGTSVDEFLDSIYAAGAELSGDDIEERAKINTFRSVSAMIAIGIINIITVPLVSKFGSSDMGRGYLTVAVLYGCIFAACHLFCFAKTKEVVEIPEKEKTPLKVQL